MGYEKHMHHFDKNPGGKNYFQDLIIDGRIILN
jgi:hypothetical protein